ncbi:hypothetical protein JAAARDRAFT_509582 [Jaapia argillacea MUCL 33604]|uniref:Uncharacterized protein n=1 Tax=Jaapia argillacea MUCL 33604 TaxID=933084 RepID=A0A067QD81_9AGAM|nr:hypothetical protein JAAARDRAFT_509582 [Jaapia argillacea MUCL 33604]
MFGGFSVAYRERSQSCSTSEHFLAFVWVQATRKQTYIWAQSIEDLKSTGLISRDTFKISPRQLRGSRARKMEDGVIGARPHSGSETVPWAWAVDSQATPHSSLTLIKELHLLLFILLLATATFEAISLHQNGQRPRLSPVTATACPIFLFASMFRKNQWETTLAVVSKAN